MANSNSGTIMGHPKGLYVLFFTEMWERFSFYGMRALLILYLVNYLFWTQEDASALFGWYVFAVYATPLLGGLIADKWLGAKRSVVVGAVLLSIGHILMAFEPLPFFYSALIFIVAGVGFLKPNISTQVGALYTPTDHRRDGAFTIFYMGINLGAFLGPLVCDWLREAYGFHYGFAAAGIGMLLGLIVYVIGQRKLVEFNQDVPVEEEQTDAKAVAHTAHVVRDRVIVLLVVFAFVILFWMAFEQAANVMVVWADKHTNIRPFNVEPPPVTLDTAGAAAASTASLGGWKNLEVGAGQTQSINPFFIIVLAPLFAMLWSLLDRRGLQPSTPAKMVLGLALVAGAFFVMAPAATSENRISTAPLAAVPAGVDPAKYGCTRLGYDAENKQLEMRGVLPDLDRLRVLGDSAPGDFKASIDALEKNSAERAAQARRGEKWELAVHLPSAPDGFRIAGAELEKVATKWDAGSKTITVTGEIKDRARNELLAQGADPAFKQAVDAVYLASAKYRVTIWWLVLHYLLATMGELCLSPVGLSLVTKAAPPKHVGLFMGGWFLATAVSEKLAHVFGGMWGTMTPARYFMIFVVVCGVGAALMAVLVRPLKRMMHGVQ